MIMTIGIGILGLLLIYFEFFVPGGLLGILGGIALIVSILFYVATQGGFWGSLIYIVLVAAFLVATIRFALWKIKQKPSLFAQEDQAGYRASHYDESLIGKEGEAASDLKPAGHILVEGKRYQAVSESHYIKKGESIKIVRGEGARLICRRK